MSVTINSLVPHRFPQDYTHGTHERNGELFAFFIDTSNEHVECWVSALGGASWSELDSAGKPTDHDAADTNNGLSSARVGDAVWLSYIGGGSFKLYLGRFSLAQRKWLTTITASAPTVNSVGYQNIFPRSDGTFLCFYGTATEFVSFVGYTRTRYRVYDVASGWAGTEYNLGEGLSQATDLIVRAAVLGNGDRVHAFMTDGTSLFHMSILPDGSWGTLQTVDATMNGGDRPIGGGCMWWDGTDHKIVLPYVDSNGDLRVAMAVSADDPTWSTELVEAAATADPFMAFPNAKAVMFNDVPHVYWLRPDDFSNADDIVVSSRISGSWTAHTVLESPVSQVKRQCVSVTEDAVHVIFEDAANVKYLESQPEGEGGGPPASTGQNFME